MNNSESAQKGFKTFILTLSISLLLFSAVYYALSTYSPENKSTQSQAAVAKETPVASVQGASTAKVESKDASVFAEISKKKPQVKSPAVLSGTTQSTQSTTAVPTTGALGITVGLALSLSLFIGAMIFTSMNPRRIALRGFEREVLKKTK